MVTLLVASSTELNFSLQSSLTNDLVEKTENGRVLLVAAKEENEKLKEVLQSEINEYKVFGYSSAHPIMHQYIRSSPDNMPLQ